MRWLRTGLACLLLAGVSCGGGDSPTSPTRESPVSNQAPSMLDMIGPDTVATGEVATYRVTAFDPDGPTVSFHFNVYQADDLENPEDLGWGPFVPNHEEYRKEIAFDTAGRYMVCAHVTDSLGLECPDWNHKERWITVR